MLLQQCDITLKPREMPKSDAYITNTNFYTVHKSAHRRKERVTEIPFRSPLLESPSPRLPKSRNLSSCTPLKDLKRPSFLQSIMSTDIISHPACVTLGNKSLITPFEGIKARSHLVSPLRFHTEVDGTRKLSPLKTEITQRILKETITPLKRNMQFLKPAEESTSSQLPPLVSRRKLTDFMQQSGAGNNSRSARKKNHDDTEDSCEKLRKRQEQLRDEYYETIKRIWNKHNVIFFFSDAAY